MSLSPLYEVSQNLLNKNWMRNAGGKVTRQDMKPIPSCAGPRVTNPNFSPSPVTFSGVVSYLIIERVCKRYI